MTTHAFTAAEDGQRPHGAVFYYFLVNVDGRPHEPAVLTTDSADRHVGEVVVLADGSRVRVRAIDTAEDETAGLDGVLVVEPLLSLQ